MSDKPGAVRGRQKLTPKEIRDLTTRYQCELASLLAVDRAVGQINRTIAQAHLTADTYVIFTSDNGYMHGEHRIRAEKVQPYEEALKVPLVIRGPAISPGQEIAAPVANVDLAPTIIDLAGIDVPADVARPLDGVSLAPYTYGRAEPDRAILIESKRPPRLAADGIFEAPSWVGVRTARYVYVEHYRAQAPSLEQGFGLPIGAGTLSDTELYDLADDPYELRSRHADPAYAATRTSLAEALAQLRSCSGADCHLQLSVPPPQ